MTPITYTEFCCRLTEYGTAVHCEKYTYNYTAYYSAEKPGDAKYFYDRGCVICTEDYEYGGKQWICRNVHQVEPMAALDAVAEEQLADAKEYAKKFAAVVLNVVVFTVSNGDLPPEKNCFLGWRNYVRQGTPVTPDPRVRILTEADADAIRACCAPSLVPDGDSRWGQMEAESFSDYDFRWAEKHGITLFGIFVDGVLAGIATSLFVQDLDLAWLETIHVAPAYRRMGLGQALVLSALAAYPDKKWHYQAARDNLPSVGLAKSLGFTLEGAGLFLV